MNLTQRFAWLVLMVALGAAAGCATASKSSGSGGSQSVLLRDEVMAVKVSNLYDAIERLRPRWLTVRGGPRSFGTETEVVVYQRQTYLGGVDVLRQFSPDMVAELRYLDGATASASLPGIGSRHVYGAIIIIPL